MLVIDVGSKLLTIFSMAYSFSKYYPGSVFFTRGKFARALPRTQPEIMAYLFIKHSRTRVRVTHFWSNGSDRFASRRARHYLLAAFRAETTKTLQLGSALSPSNVVPVAPNVSSVSKRSMYPVTDRPTR